METDDWAVIDLERLVIHVGRSMRQCRRLGVAFASRGLDLVEGDDAEKSVGLVGLLDRGTRNPAA